MLDLPDLPDIPGPSPEQRPERFRGKSIGSTPEWWIIKVLLAMKKNFFYQYTVHGGYRKGGFVVDFFVFHPPNNVIIEYYGDYWHEGSLGSDDRLREIELQRATGASVEGVFGSDSEDEDAVAQRVREILK